MSFPALILRTKRKFRADGMRPLLSEVITKSLESEPIRVLVRQALFKHGSVLEQSQLQDKANRHWDCEPRNPFEIEVPIPEKTRLRTSGSFERLDTYLPTDPFVVELHDVTVLAPSGLAITDDSQFVKDTVASAQSSNSRIEKALARSIQYCGYRRTRTTIRESNVDADQVYSLATALVPLWRNYYHWTLECLPRMLGVETYREQTGESPTIILPPKPTSWIRESLELVGIDENTTGTLEPGLTRVTRLIVPSYPTPSRTECHWLRKRVHDRIDPFNINTDEYPSRIYISRRNANVRRIKNEDALLPVLSEYDIEPYALETLTVAEQARLFANADFVVSPHGAGLANLVYGTSPTVLELFGFKEKATFYRLAKLMGFEYHAMFCDHERKDIVADPNRLENTISDILAGEKAPVLQEQQSVER